MHTSSILSNLHHVELKELVQHNLCKGARFKLHSLTGDDLVSVGNPLQIADFVNAI